jgi:hypothetical protein
MSAPIGRAASKMVHHFNAARHPHMSLFFNAIIPANAPIVV